MSTKKMPKRTLHNDKDVVVSMFIEVKYTDELDLERQYQEISYLLNECCSNLEGIKCSVFYKMKDSLSGRQIELEPL